MERFTFINAKGGRVVVGGHRDDFLLTAHSGTTSAEVLTTSRRGFSQNGRFYVNTHLGVRIITLEFVAKRKDDVSFYSVKRSLSQILNPLLGEGTLIYKNDFIEKQITVSVTGMPELSAKDQILGRYTVEFTAHDPFWTDTADTTKNFSSFTGGLTFPLQFEGQNIVFAVKGMSQEVYVPSDVETSIRVVFSGACVRPVLMNNSIGKKIVIDTSITHGERIVVTTGYGDKNIVKMTGGGEVNVNNLITDDSEFFSLRPGVNLLAFDADAGTPEIVMTYRNLYTGV